MKDKTFSEVMDEIVNTISRVPMKEATTTTLAVLLAQLQTRYELDTKTVDVSFYDQERIVENCTVQILRNSVTGDESFGWFIERGKNDDRRISEAYETETE